MYLFLLSLEPWAHFSGMTSFLSIPCDSKVSPCPLPSKSPVGPRAPGVKPTGHADAGIPLLRPEHPFSEGLCLCPCVYPYFIWLMIKCPLTPPLLRSCSTLGERIDEFYFTCLLNAQPNHRKVHIARMNSRVNVARRVSFFLGWKL